MKLRYFFSFLLSLFLLSQGLYAEHLKALFLGGGGGQPHTGHNGRINHLKLIPHFLKAGIELNYSSNLDDLNPKTLAKYDTVILYLGATNNKPERVDALIDYVNQGGGFVGVHQTCGAFEGRSDFVALIGGEFARHGSGYFTANHVKGQENHPALGGIPEFEAWDETYVHKNLNEDRTDLQTRDEKGRPEPWTWVRSQGKGRVFYTAHGHDGRVWGVSHFQKMITAATIWTSGKTAMERKDIPTLTYRDDHHGHLHNHEKRRGKQMIQNQLKPEESAKCMVLPEGFETQLVAHEPDIVNPIDVIWDDRGRMYVAETVSYPQIAKEAKDRIKICEDTNGDGVMDKFTVFAEGFNLHTGMCWVNGGIILAQAPDMFFLKDTDGDDKADLIKKINTGWGLSDLHGGPSNLKYSFDNKIYGCVGGGGYKNEDGRFSGGIWRMDVDGRNFTPISNLGGNSWGLGISEDFELFASSANKGPAKHIHAPYPYFEALGLKKAPARPIFDYSTFYPLTITRQGDHFGQYTAGTGFEVYTARSFPQKYWNKSAFVGGPTGKLLGQFFIERDNQGSYIARNKGSLMASFDEYTAPISGKTGPDGHVYMLDWNNLIMLHGGETQNPLRDKTHGRIYRIVHKESKPSTVLNLHGAQTSELIDAYKHENLFWRLMAQQKIVQQNRKDAIPNLIEMAKDKQLDEIGSNPMVIHALWSLHGLGQLDGSNKQALAVAQAALKHPSAAVRKNAVRVLPSIYENTALVGEMLKEKDANTLRHVLLTLSTMPSSNDIGQKLYEMKDAIVGKKALQESYNLAFVRHGAALVEEFIEKKPNREKEKEGLVEKQETKLVNILQNPSFEEIEKDLPSKWKFKVHKGEAELQLDHQVARTGKVSVRIDSKNGGGAEVLQINRLEVGQYLFSAWVKTKDVKEGNGVLLRANGRGVKNARSTSIEGTHDEWQKLQLNFRVNEESGILLFCLFGAWDNSKGTVWYDDIELIQLSSEKVVKKVTAVESLLAKQVFEKGAEDIIRVVKLINTKKESNTNVFMKGLSDVRNVSFSPSQEKRLRALADDAAPKNKMPLAVFASYNQLDLGLSALANSIKGFEVEILKGDVQRGKELSAACIVCHGEDFGGVPSERTPPISQLADWTLQTQMQKFKHNIRGNDVADADGLIMKNVMQEFSHQQIADLSAYIRTHQIKTQNSSIDGDHLKGKELYANCMACHQMDGSGNQTLHAPRISGLSHDYIVKQLQMFKSEVRGSGDGDKPGKLMQVSAKMLKDEQAMKDVAAYISTLKVQKEN